MNRFSSLGRLHRGAWLAATLLVAVGCSQDESRPAPLGSEEPREDLSLAVEISSASAKPGDRIAVALRAAASDKLLGIQGTLEFDPAQLRFVGQRPADDVTLALANDDQAAQGKLTYLAVNSRDGLKGHIAPLVFEVTGADYARGLRYSLSEAVLRGEVALHHASIAAGAEVAAGLAAAADARRMDAAAWAQALYREQGPSVADGLSLAPGQRRAGLVYGDVNLSGGFSGVDVAQTANVSLGRIGFDLIVGTDSATGNNRDFAIAANVRPAGPPIGGADPSRVISVLDVQALQATFLNGSVDAAGVVNTPIRPADNAGCSNLVVPAGTITGSVSWNVPRPCFVQLDGIVRVGDDGNGPAGELTIAAGTLVKGNSSINPSALFIQRNGRIIAIGTQENPIEFSCTAAVPAAACWGGIYIAGNASVNEGQAAVGTSPAITGRQTGGANQRQGEGGAPIIGGNNDADSSGVLRYVVIQYAGFELAPNNELNCLTLGAIGAGTDIDHIHCHGGSDDNFELFGGTVDLQYLVATGNADDGFDFSFGWNGRAQYVIVAQDATAGADKGIEADNTEDPLTFDNTPRTTPELYNFTFVRNGGAGDAIHVRRGTSPEMGHFAIIGYSVGLDVDDQPSCQRLRRGLQGITTLSHDSPGLDSLVLYRSRLAVSAVGNSDADAAVCNSYATPTAERDFVGNPALLNDTTAAAPTALLISPFGTNPDWRPVTGQLAAPAGSTLPGARAGHISFNSAGANFIGAVAPAPATLNTVPWYAGWIRIR